MYVVHSVGFRSVLVLGIHTLSSIHLDICCFQGACIIMRLFFSTPKSTLTLMLGSSKSAPWHLVTRVTQARCEVNASCVVGGARKILALDCDPTDMKTPILPQLLDSFPLGRAWKTSCLMKVFKLRSLLLKGFAEEMMPTKGFELLPLRILWKVEPKG